MSTERFRNVVVGAGAMGLATAYHLAKRGEPVLLVEQFALGHDRGSSHGAARIIRHSYADPTYARLMPAAFAAWRKLEVDAGETLYLRTGGVSISPFGVSYVASVASSLTEIGVEHRRMSGGEWNYRHSAFHLPDEFDVIFEPDAGMLKAARVLEVEADLFLRLGPDSKIREYSAVIGIDRKASRPTLITADGRIEADRLIVTAGAWTNRLVTSLADRLQPTRQVVCYLRPKDPNAFAIGRFPVFIFKGPGDLDAFYGMPSALGVGVKVGRHGGLNVDPDVSSREITESDREPLWSFLDAYLPGLAASPIEKHEVCLYTMAYDDQFQVGMLPERSDIIVASPCSGHGFKFSCLIGSILADLALVGQTELDISAWEFDQKDSASNGS